MSDKTQRHPFIMCLKRQEQVRVEEITGKNQEDKEKKPKSPVLYGWFLISAHLQTIFEIYFFSLELPCWTKVDVWSYVQLL